MVANQPHYPAGPVRPESRNTNTPSMVVSHKIIKQRCVLLHTSSNVMCYYILRRLFTRRYGYEDMEDEERREEVILLRQE